MDDNLFFYLTKDSCLTKQRRPAGHLNEMTCHSSQHHKQTNVQIMSSASPDTLPWHTGELQGRRAECFARGHIVSGRAGVQIHVCLSLTPGFFPLLFFLVRVFSHLKGDSHLQPIGYLVFLLLILFKGQIPVLPHSSQTLVKVRWNQWDPSEVCGL